MGIQYLIVTEVLVSQVEEYCKGKSHAELMSSGDSCRRYLSRPLSRVPQRANRRRYLSSQLSQVLQRANRRKYIQYLSRPVVVDMHFSRLTVAGTSAEAKCRRYFSGPTVAGASADQISPSGQSRLCLPIQLTSQRQKLKSAQYELCHLPCMEAGLMLSIGCPKSSNDALSVVKG